MTDEQTADTPGWRAIEEAFRSVHGADQPARRLGTSFGEPRGTVVWAIDAYSAPGHWHLVTVGLSEPWGKHSDDAKTGGWGFELTLKLPRDAGDHEPPGWAVNLLKIVGDSVYRTGKPLAEGSRLDIGAPVTGRIHSRLEALALTPDTEVAPIPTPNGRVEFLQVVGITRAELEAMQASSTADVLGDIRASNPRLLTDPGR